MKISAYLSMNEARLTNEQTEAARAAGGEWVIVSVRDGRQLVSCLAPEPLIQALMGMLAAHHPRLLGVWDIAGQPLLDYPVRTAEYLTLMPDVVVSVDADSLPILSRPTVARDVCLWAGWAERSFP